jgi:hypothetical protein
VQRITAYRTSDGEVFTDHRAAVRHLDEKMGSIIIEHARRLAQIDKYTATIDYLVTNLASLAEAAAWQKEMTATDIHEDDA